MRGNVTATIEGTERFKAKIRAMQNACRSNEAKQIGRAGAEIIAASARSYVHVITGDLRGSIRVVDSDEPGVAQVLAGGVNGVDYAAEEEFGNSRRPAHPYMRPAVDTSKSKVRTVMRQRSYALIRKAAKE